MTKKLNQKSDQKGVCCEINNYNQVQNTLNNKKPPRGRVALIIIIYLRVI